MKKTKGKSWLITPKGVYKVVKIIMHEANSDESVVYYNLKLKKLEDK